MIHYRDRTFCASQCASPCATRECLRHRDNVPADTGGLPVAWGYFHGACPDYTPTTCTAPPYGRK